MFEGMSDDEDEFQSVSLSSTSDIMYWKTEAANGCKQYVVCVNVCDREALQVPPTEAGSQQEYDQCLWATVERQAPDLLHRASWQLLWPSLALLTAVLSLQQQLVR